MLQKILSLFKKNENDDIAKESADIAKERLSMIVSYSKSPNANSLGKDYLAAMQQELFAVITKYVGVVNDDMIEVKLEKKEHHDRLEINVELPI